MLLLLLLLLLVGGLEAGRLLLEEARRLVLEIVGTAGGLHLHLVPGRRLCRKSTKSVRAINRA